MRPFVCCRADAIYQYNAFVEVGRLFSFCHCLFREGLVHRSIVRHPRSLRYSVNPIKEEAISSADMTVSTQAPPPRLDDGTSLFLDLDGTLLELIDRPDEVCADALLRATLLDVQARLKGRLAIVSGRSIAQLEAILGAETAEQLVLSGSHGSEYRWEGQSHSPERPASLDTATEEMRRFAQSHDVFLEEKSFGVGLHYRLMPSIESDARALAQRLSSELGLFLQEGKMMVELRPAGHDKGVAIRHLMEHSALSAARPVFAGDDITDESGFEAVSQLGGYGILVGAARPSAAHYHLPHPQAVRNWLKELLI